MLAAACTSPSSGLESTLLDPETFPLTETTERDVVADVCGETLEGDELCLDDLAGTPVVLNFWASWCGPCAREMPELEDLRARYAGEVAVVGVNTDDTETNARSFVRDQGVTFPSFFDAGAIIASRVEGVAPRALPSTILIDAEQRVALTALGAVSEAQLVPYLEQLLAETR